MIVKIDQASTRHCPIGELIVGHIINETVVDWIENAITFKTTSGECVDYRVMLSNLDASNNGLIVRLNKYGTISIISSVIRGITPDILGMFHIDGGTVNITLNHPADTLASITPNKGSKDGNEVKWVVYGMPAQSIKHSSDNEDIAEIIEKLIKLNKVDFAEIVVIGGVLHKCRIEMEKTTPINSDT